MLVPSYASDTGDAGAMTLTCLARMHYCDKSRLLAVVLANGKLSGISYPTVQYRGLIHEKPCNDDDDDDKVSLGSERMARHGVGMGRRDELCGYHGIGIEISMRQQV